MPAVKSGLFVEAAKDCLEMRRPYDAPVCSQKANLPRECLQALLKVVPGSVPYRSASVHAVRIAFTMGDPLKKLGSFIAAFLNTPPVTTAEAAAFKQLAHEMANTQHRAQARAVF